ncbi:glycosyltransferase [Hufsiella ginkgonis]|uniref:Glycosyltransferase n=1 Tax=Hufsiella ginkgonis TaxID=2695274 RepID=A0A7K1Y2K2_9SPHI|nr:glycosyltransferase [Hufsiella ginkgonis]MXV17442.1 glycosyltransferase [Hufsiella ginkgonis]
MKLLHVIGSMDPRSGGPCQGIRNSNSAMVNLGVEREIVCLDAPDASFLGMDDFPIHALGPARGPWHYAEKLYPWLMNNLGRFDVVIINGLWIYSSYAAHRAFKKLKRASPGADLPRVYVMPHGMLDPYFQRARDRRFKAIRNWFYWKLVERAVVNDSAGLLFTCETELLLARGTFSGYRPRKELNVGYGIVQPPDYTPQMSEAFSARCPGLDGQPYLLFLSRIHGKKGVDLLIKSFAAHIKASASREKALPKLVIAGPGTETPYGKRLVYLINQFPHLKERVLFTGMLTGDAKWGAVYGCEAFILPSHQENFGIAVVEALACKKPVLISNQVNICMEIHAGGAGIVATDTLTGTWDLLRKWFSLGDEERAQMGQNALAVYQSHFHIDPFSVALHQAISE